MVFEREWMKLMVLLAGISILIIGAIHIAAAFLSQKEDRDNAETFTS